MSTENQKLRVYKDVKTRLWKCQDGLIVGTGTTIRGAYQHMQARLQCPQTQIQLRGVS